MSCNVTGSATVGKGVLAWKDDLCIPAGASNVRGKSSGRDVSWGSDGWGGGCLMVS